MDLEKVFEEIKKVNKVARALEIAGHSSIELSYYDCTEKQLLDAQDHFKTGRYDTKDGFFWFSTGGNAGQTRISIALFLASNIGPSDKLIAICGAKHWRSVK